MLNQSLEEHPFLMLVTQDEPRPKPKPVTRHSSPFTPKEIDPETFDLTPTKAKAQSPQLQLAQRVTRHPSPVTPEVRYPGLGETLTVFQNLPTKPGNQPHGRSFDARVEAICTQSRQAAIENPAWSPTNKNPRRTRRLSWISVYRAVSRSMGFEF
jgi:hypothetical protein